jgi:prepilin-type processing-associated H-X9-DG protein
LVVFAFIAFLAAILFPVFARARENARRSSCLSNIKQIGIGLLQYVQDNDEVLPADWVSAVGFNPADPSTIIWQDAIQPYVKNAQVFNCPSAPAADRFIPDNNAVSNFGSYSMNHTYYGASDNLMSPMSDYQPGRQGPVGIAQEAVPATTVWIVESGTDTQYPSPLDFYWDVPIVPTFMTTTTNLTFLGSGTGGASGGGGPVARHLDSSNILFCDGHVKAMKLSNLLERSSLNNDALRMFTINDD